MEDLELKNLWFSYEKKLADAQLLNAQSWALNLRCFAEIQQKKAASKLRALAIHNVFAVLLGIVWVLFLGVLVWGNGFVNPYFCVSVAAIALFSLYAVIVYIRHTAIINSIDYNESVVAAQEKLARLQTSTFRSIRVLWLQMPFYTTFWWSPEFVSTGASFWLISFPITLLFVVLAVYLYRNLRVENMHKKWVRAIMMAGPELRNVVRSMAFLEEIESLRKDV